MHRLSLAVLALPLALVLAACGGGGSASSGPPAASTAASPGASAQPAPSAATIAVDSPANGATVPAGDLTVKYTVTGATLVAPVSAKGPTDLDVVVLLDADPGQYIGRFQPAPSNNPNIVQTADGTATFHKMDAGKHTLSMYLSSANRVSVNPPVWTTVTFTAQ